MQTQSLEATRNPWVLLSKAGSWCQLGFLNEAVIASDEAVESELKTVFDKLGIPCPTDREKAVHILRDGGVRISDKVLLRLNQLREKAERGNEDSIAMSDAEEAISIAENFVSRISRPCRSAKPTHFCQHSSDVSEIQKEGLHITSMAGDKETASMLLLDTFNSMGSLSHRPKETGQGEIEFITKLLLARSILNFKKKRIPRIIGLVFTLMLAAVSCFIGGIGTYGLVLMFTGQSYLSIMGLLFDCAFILIAYFLLKITIRVKGETR